MSSLTPNMESILQFLQGWRGTKFKSSEIAKQIGISPHGISPTLHSLVDQGLIEMENSKTAKLWHCKAVVVVEPGSVAQSRTFEFKEMPLYDMKSHMRLCEESRSLKNGGLI